MKYIKTYESEVNYHYNIGDYILLKNIENWNIKDIAIIIDIPDRNLDKIIINAESSNSVGNKELKLWININKVERKLTSKEIKEFKLQKDINKYNL